jgi:hypothetical protein
MVSALRKSVSILTTCAALFAAAGCGPTAVRGSETPGLDDAAMSTKLDRRDLEDMLAKNLDSLQSSAIVKTWEGEDQPTVAVLPIRNETSEHIDSALNALISKIETALVNGGHVQVVSVQDQPEVLDQLRQQQGDAFDKSQIAGWGKQVGARYFVTGKVYSTDERDDDGRRVQYFLFMRVLEAETGLLKWQNEQSVTKAILD